MNTSMASVFLFALVGYCAGQVVFNSAQFFTSGPITVSNFNGVTTYIVNGKPLNLDRAKVIKETAEFKLLQPIEVPEAKIHVYKMNRGFTIDYMGYHLQSFNNAQFSHLTSP